MRIRLHIWLGVFAGLGLTAQAISPGPSIDQFSNIPERNVFGLKSGQPEAEPAPKGPPPRLTLTGITTLLGNKLALMRAAIPAAPGTPAQDKPLMLSEGQRDGNIEVLGIDEKQGSVRVNDAGEVMTLTFAKNGVKTPTPGTVTTTAGRTNYLPSALTPGARMRVMPTRTPRTPVTGTAAPETGAITTNSYGGVATTSPSASDLALSPTGYTNGYPYQAPAPAQLTPQEQALLQAIQQAVTESNNPTPAPLPPALAPPPGSPYPSMPSGASLQRPRPPLYPQ